MKANRLAQNLQRQRELNPQPQKSESKLLSLRYFLIVLQNFHIINF